ncbi:S8 family serine peptidase [Olivibacter sp. CPCC 100613]|uniref:S8 family serine peptidase n=1 Tax=Olivibacter sp. CPCC 100613 TaxID=3079931 RepID=UPI002FF8E978
MKALNELLINETPRFYYNEFGEKQPLNPIPDALLLQLDVSDSTTKDDFSLSSFQALSKYISDKKLVFEEQIPPFLEVLINESNDREGLLSEIQRYIETVSILNVSQMYTDSTGIKVALLNQLIVKFKEEPSAEELNKLRSDFRLSDISQVYRLPNAYILTLPKDSDLDALEVSNKIFETGKAVYAQPNFFRSLKASVFNPNDPLYPSQWHLPKIQAPGAWCWTRGTGVNIGIMDSGIQLNHIDLSTMSGYDGTGMPLGTDRHGTNCAGAAAAVGNNATLLTGVAFASTVVQLRIGYNPSSDPNYGFINSTDQWKYNAFAAAVYDLPVHVISCSIGFGNPGAIVYDGIYLAYTTGGRSGRGIPMFAASGNNSAGTISFPASSPYTMGIGASTSGDTRASFSNYGAGLGLVAPGVGIITTAYQNTSANLDGTSFATPITAGVAAMILQFQPNYTPTQVYQILGNTADKVGGYSYSSYPGTYPFGTWNNQMGYGRVNALKAIQQATPYKATGTAIVCSSGTFQVPNLPAGASVTWSTSVHFSIVGSNTANPVTVQKGTTGWGTITATVNSACGTPLASTLTVPSGAAPVPGTMQISGPFNLNTNERGLFTFPTTYPGVPPTGYVFLVNGQQSGSDFQIDFFSYGEAEITFYSAGSYPVTVQVQTPCGNVQSFPFYVNVT